MPTIPYWHNGKLTEFSMLMYISIQTLLKILFLSPIFPFLQIQLNHLNYKNYLIKNAWKWNESKMQKQ